MASADCRSSILSLHVIIPGMKTAVVFYTLDGGCAFVAYEIKALLNADLVRLDTVKKKPRTFAGKLFWGVGMVFRGKKPPLKPWTFDPSAYDLIIIGAPVWADHPAPPINTFISSAGLCGKKIAVFVCHGGGMKEALGILKKSLNGNNIIGEADFIYPLKNSGKVQQQTAEWVKSISS